jgi:hypothetical protein
VKAIRLKLWWDRGPVICPLEPLPAGIGVEVLDETDTVFATLSPHTPCGDDDATVGNTPNPLEILMQDAQRAANESKVAIAVVRDEIGNAEDHFDPYGFCPLTAVALLHRHGKVLCVIAPQRPARNGGAL